MSDNTLDYLRGQFDAQKEYLDDKFEHIDRRFDEAKTDQEKKDKAQDQRISKLEHLKWIHTGAASLGGVVGGVLTALGLGKFKF